MLRIAPAVCALQAKEKKKKEKTNLSIFELESKCDNLEHDDEKLIWKPIIKQKLCPLKHGCIRDHANQFTGLAQKSFSLGTAFAWRETEKFDSLWILNCFISPCSQRPVVFWHGNVLFFYAKQRLQALLYVITHSYKHRGGKIAFLANSLTRAPPALCVSASH